jgi:site-specific recombinase XerD
MVHAFQAHLIEELHRPRRTVISYTRGINCFLDYVGNARGLNIGPENIDREITLGYLQWMQTSRGFKASTCSLYFTAAFLFFRWAHSAGKVREFVLQGIPKLRVPFNLPKPIAANDMSKLLRLPNLETKRGVRDLALLEILYGSGLRCMELLSLKFSDVQRGSIGGLAHVRVVGKGNKQRLVPLTKPALRALDRYIELRHSKKQSDLIFLGDRGNPMEARALQRATQAYGRAAGLEGIHPHRFRHSMASHLIQNGVPIEIIAELLGHSNLNTTRIYAQITPVQSFLAYKKAGFREKLPA